MIARSESMALMSKVVESWQPLLAWKKDPLPMGLFQYGNAFLPDGQNETPLPRGHHDRSRIRRHGNVALHRSPAEIFPSCTFVPFVVNALSSADSLDHVP